MVGAGFSGFAVVVAWQKRLDKMKLVRLGEWDHSIIILGIPGFGKTVYATDELLRLGKSPCYMLAHDPAWRMPTVMPDGRKVPLERHKSIADMRKALETRPAMIHALTRGDGEEVLAFSEQVAAASIARHGADAGIPVMALLDEGVATKSADPYRIGHGLRSFNAERRGKNVGLIMTAQDPTYIHKSLYALATKLVVFRMNDMEAVGKLCRKFRALGTPESIGNLPKFQPVEITLNA